MSEEALEIEYRLACETRLRPQAPMRAKDGTASPPLPRITQLMALAIKLEGMRREGIIRDYSEVARLGHVSRARVSQIMSLLQLAPDLQEQLLFLPALQHGRVALTEPRLRRVARQYDWDEQRRLFQQAIRSSGA